MRECDQTDFSLFLSSLGSLTGRSSSLFAYLVTENQLCHVESYSKRDLIFLRILFSFLIVDFPVCKIRRQTRDRRQKFCKDMFLKNNIFFIQISIKMDI